MKKRFLLLLLLSMLCWASTAGPASGTASDDGALACNGADWAGKTNLASSDNSYATCVLPGASPGDALWISSLGFSVPAGATINGVTVTYERKCSFASSCSTDPVNGGTAQITKTAGTPTGNDKGSATGWATSDVTDSLGSGSDLWGLSWTVAEINAAGFGFYTVVYNANALARTASLDYLAVTATYTPAAGAVRRRAIISGWNPRDQSFCWPAGAWVQCAQVRMASQIRRRPGHADQLVTRIP